MSEEAPKRRLPLWSVFIIGLVVGIIGLLAIRVATYSPEHTHYHANFAVYLNGKREAFKGAQYYQEVAVCSGDHGILKPEQRTHMHENINDVVHVHDHVVTWGQFFNNLGWTVSGDIIETDSGTKYVADDINKVHIIIDGQDYTDINSIANMVIKNTSRLLISYGPDDQAALKQQFASVAKTAEKQNQSKDPASCAGSEKLPFSERLKHAL